MVLWRAIQLSRPVILQCWMHFRITWEVFGGREDNTHRFPNILKPRNLFWKISPGDYAMRSGLDPTGLDPPLHCTDVPMKPSKMNYFPAVTMPPPPPPANRPSLETLVSRKDGVYIQAQTASLRRDYQHKTEHTHTARNQIWPRHPSLMDTRSKPAHSPSHLLPVFPKRPQLLRLFRLLHGRLFSLQLLSNLKHKMLSAYVIWVWPDHYLGCTGAGPDLPSSAN